MDSILQGNNVGYLSGEDCNHPRRRRHWEVEGRIGMRHRQKKTDDERARERKQNPPFVRPHHRRCSSTPSSFTPIAQKNIQVFDRSDVGMPQSVCFCIALFASLHNTHLNQPCKLNPVCTSGVPHDDDIV